MLINPKTLILLVVVLVLGSGSSSRAQQTYTWRQIGQLPAAGGKWDGYCGYFWNAQTGVVANKTQFYYTRDGHTWIPGKSFPSRCWINSIRCFDGHTLYAPVMYGGRDQSSYFSNVTAEVWMSADSGVSWQLFQTTKASFGIDVYWNYVKKSPSTAHTFSTVARIDSLNLVGTFDDGNGGWILYSADGGNVWNQINALRLNFPFELGYGIAADTATRTVWAALESVDPCLVRSTDYGHKWTVMNGLPGKSWLDDVESAAGRVYYETQHGFYVSSDGGTTWPFIGGPSGGFDDARFCVFGCHGLTVVAFDFAGRIWIANEWDAPGPNLLHSTFETSTFECDTSILDVTLDSSTAHGSYKISISGDSTNVFHLIGSDTITVPPARLIRIRFHANDLITHHATLHLTPLSDARCQSGDYRNITGTAFLGPTRVVAISPVVVCSTGSSKIYITSPVCDSIRLTQITSALNIAVLPFDSVINGFDSITLAVQPAAKDTTVFSRVHLQGFYEQSGVAFDTVVTIVVKTNHIRSTLGWPPVTNIGLAQPTTCDDIDTAIVVWNTGCDTLDVELMESLSTGWSIAASPGSHRLKPGEADTIRAHFHSMQCGTHPATLALVYHLGNSYLDSIRFQFIATVPADTSKILVAPTSLALGTRSFCGDTLLHILLHNPACDSMLISNIRLSQGTTFALLSPQDTTIGPDLDIDEAVIFSPDRHGAAFDTLWLHYQSQSGNIVGDTMILFSADVARGYTALSLQYDSIDCGATSICEERDTLVVIRNVGCDTVWISDVSVAPSTFKLSKPWYSHALAPEGKDTVWLRSQIDTTGGTPSNVATLSVLSDADTVNGTLTLEREISYPPQWSVHLIGPDSNYAGRQVSYKIEQRGQLPAAVTTLTYRLRYDADLLTFDKADEAFVQATPAIRQASGDAEQIFSLTSIPSDSTLSTLHFTTFLTKDRSSAITIDSLGIASRLDRPMNCVANVTLDSTSATVLTSCGQPFMRSLMYGEPIVIQSVSPNPTTGLIEVQCMNLSGFDATGMITVEDALGRPQFSEPILLSAGAQMIPFSLENLAAGVYLLRISSLHTIASERIIKQ